MRLKIGIGWLGVFGGAALTLIILVCVPSSNGQLDLPSKPGPPYPDGRGQNRWGVKFDPRKHGPPYDKRTSAQKNVLHHHMVEKRPPRRQFKDSFWSPAIMMRSYSRLRRPRRQHKKRFANEPRHHRRRPRIHSKNHQQVDEQWKWPATMHNKPNKEEEKQFWKAWNAWYRKQEEGKEQLKKGRHNHHHPHPIVKEEEEEEEEPLTVHINESEEATDNNDDDPEEHRGHKSNVIEGKLSLRDYYRKRMEAMYKKAKDMASSFTKDGEAEAEEDKGKDDNGQSKSSTGSRGSSSWGIFTSIGKGLDAAGEAMGSVRKTVGGSILGTGMKYGGKMVMDSVMNVGTSALTTAIKSAAPFG